VKHQSVHPVQLLAGLHPTSHVPQLEKCSPFVLLGCCLPRKLPSFWKKEAFFVSSSLFVCCCLLAKSFLCNPVDCSTPGFPVLHHLPELAQTHVHRVGDAIQPSHPLSPPSPPALNLSQHQDLFQWVSSSHIRQLVQITWLVSSRSTNRNLDPWLLTYDMFHYTALFFTNCILRQNHWNTVSST